MCERPFPDLTPQQLADLHARFEAIRPQIETHGRIYFRHHCSQRRADLMAEMGHTPVARSGAGSGALPGIRQ